MKQFFNLKNNFFYIFIFIYFFAGVFLSLNVGITHDEHHDLIVWELKKKEFLNIILKENYDVSFLGSGGKYYGIGFHLLSLPIETIIKFFLSFFPDFKNSINLISKHASVFIFFLVSGIFFQKIILLITKNKNYSIICTILYLLYPYLLGHSFFNIKDIPFLSVWLICTYYITKIFISFLDSEKVYALNSLILGFLTAFLLSIRISGILILIQYMIFFLVAINISNFNILNFIKKFKKEVLYFFLTFFLIFYILHPVYWQNPFTVIQAIIYMSDHVQTVCTTTLGDCMKAQDLPSTYIPIWLFFKLPILILFGLFILPITEKRIFNNSQNSLIIGSLIITLVTIIFILIIFNVNLYDELRQIMFLVPLFFLISLSSIYFFSKKFSYLLILIMTFFFIYQNIKIFPYNYVWLNNFTFLTKINKSFELDYWGVSTKEIANYFNKKDLRSEDCVISNRNDGIKAFMKNETCFLSFDKIHSKNKRPFYIALTERSLNKGVPNNCKNIYNEEIEINFSKENILLAKVFRCD